MTLDGEPSAVAGVCQKRDGSFSIGMEGTG